MRTVAMINGYGQNGLRPASGVPGYPAQTAGVASAPPPPPPLPGETVEFSAPSAPAAPATPPGITTPSGVHSQHFADQFGVGMKATLPAGVLLPAPVLIQLLQTPQGVKAEAHLENKEKTQVPVQMMNDGRVAVQLENSPNAPLLMFNPTNLDYGLSSQPKQEGGATKRALEETIHPDGSRTLFQNTSFNPDGSVSYNHVHQAANGQTQAANVVQDRTGRVVQNNPLQANIDGDGKVSLQGQAAGGGRSLKDHMKSSLSNWGSLRGPLLNWMSEKKEAQAQQQISTNFVTFSSTMAKYPHAVFPTLAQAPQAPSAAPAPAPLASNTPPPPPLGEVAAATDAAAAAKAGPLANVIMGDLTKIPADGLIANINTERMWFGGIDSAIQNVGGGQYHAQASAGDLTEGNTIVARGKNPHQGAFKDVVFVVDDGNKDLADVVYNGLTAAEQAGLKSVNLPAMRTGVMASGFGVEQNVQGMADGIARFREKSGGSLKDINVVVYDRPELAAKYQQALSR